MVNAKSHAANLRIEKKNLGYTLNPVQIAKVPCLKMTCNEKI